MAPSSFRSHLTLAHHTWQQVVVPGDTVIDATCGNGHDTLALARLALDTDQGRVVACDVQQQALDSTQALLQTQLPPPLLQRVEWHRQCHSTLPQHLEEGSVKLIAYNLGYLPGSDKTLTTTAETTLQSLQHAMDLVAPSGLISITCYPGHTEGRREEKLILDFVTTLNKTQWLCCHHRWPNRHRAPSLLLIQPL